MSGPCSRSPTTDSTSASLPDHYRCTRLRFLPLLSIETNLKQQLHPENCSVSRTPEICTWAAVLKKVSFARYGQMTNERSEDDPAMVLAAFKHDIISLWEDETIQGVLKRRGICLEDLPGFFLNDTARIATVDYIPTEGMLRPWLFYCSSPSCSRGYRPRQVTNLWRRRASHYTR
jgi:hypothetical protein